MNSELNGWRRDAAGIVEELFAASAREHWDALLELRGLILSGADWDRALDVFLELRGALEVDSYLPMYRLRNLLAESLRLEAVSGTGAWSLRTLLRRRHKSLESVCREVSRWTFEHKQDTVNLRVVEVL
ncbi:MAG: hypothetical protein Fur0032_19550 [Terrimicrobiaceae bacterium]